jgi:hypothetical protein
MQRVFDRIEQKKEGIPCSRRDCKEESGWHVFILSKRYYLCDKHFQEYEQVIDTRLYNVEKEMIAYFNKVNAESY